MYHFHEVNAVSELDNYCSVMELRLEFKLSIPRPGAYETWLEREQVLSFERMDTILCSSVVVLYCFVLFLFVDVPFLGGGGRECSGVQFSILVPPTPHQLTDCYEVLLSTGV